MRGVVVSGGLPLARWSGTESGRQYRQWSAFLCITGTAVQIESQCRTEGKHYAQKTLRCFVSHPGAGHFPQSPSPNRNLSGFVHSTGSLSARRSRRCWGPHCRIKHDSTRVFQRGARRVCRSRRGRRRPRTQDEPRRLWELSCAAHGRGNEPGRESSGGLCDEERGHQ